MYEQHPLSAFFPSMAGDDYQALVDDIDVYGQREPVMIFEGMVLDGWHRYSACIKLGMEPTKFEFKGDDPVAFVMSQNLHRRHLTGSQRAAAVVACSAWMPANRPIASKVAVAATLPKTNDEMAKEAGVKTRTISDVKTAQKAGLIDSVKEGAMTAEEAAKVARGQFEKTSKHAPPIEHSDEPNPVQILSEENDRLTDRLAVVAMDATPEERTAAAETIDSLRTKIKVLEATLRAVTASRDGYMQENSEMKKQLAGYKKKFEHLKK